MVDSSAGLVSVIVPFLNGSTWLLEALESVLQQTYTNWELIVMDDGSDNKHSSIAKDFCAKHSGKILYAEHDGHVNKGVTISRNEAVKLAHGKYLAFLDADDIWMPEKLANQLTHFINTPEVQVVCNPCMQWLSWKDKTAKDYVDYIGDGVNGIYMPGSLTKLLYPLKNTSSPPPSGIMITKEAFERVGGFEPAFSGIYELYEDQAFLCKLYLKEVVYISVIADYLYRQRNDSMSSAAANTERYHIVRNFYFNFLQSFMLADNIYDEEINKLIKNARSLLIINDKNAA